MTLFKGGCLVKKIAYELCTKDVLEQLPKGAFMNVAYEGKENTMTIGWGNVGFMWAKPVFTAMVRYSRYTYELVDKAKEFTISVPLNGQLKEALGICGSKSGRDVDKFELCNLHKLEGQDVSSPMIEECDLHLECKVVYQQGMEADLLNDDIKAKKYSDGNYHVLYYGEILGVYKKEK